jgi:hypothetical protein
MAEEELNNLNETLRDAKSKAKAEIENEYANLKNTEAKKFSNSPGDDMTDHVPYHQRVLDDYLLPYRFAELLFEILSERDINLKQQKYNKFQKI